MTQSDEQSGLISTDKCFVGIGIDKDSETFTSVHILPGQEKEFAELLFLLLSGKATDTILESLKAYLLENLNVNGEVVLDILTKKMLEVKSANQSSSDKDRPCILPSQVAYFNEFFGK